MCVSRNCWTLCQKNFYFWRSNKRGSWKTEQYDNALICGVFNHGSSTPNIPKKCCKKKPMTCMGKQDASILWQAFFLLTDKPFQSEKGLFSFFITHFVATLCKLMKCDKMSFSLLISWTILDFKDRNKQVILCSNVCTLDGEMFVF